MYVLVSMRSWCTAYARHRSLCLLRLCSLCFSVSCGALPEGMAVTLAAILAGKAAQNNMQEYRCSLHKRCRCQCGACTTSPQVTAGGESASVEFVSVLAGVATRSTISKKREDTASQDCNRKWLSG